MTILKSHCRDERCTVNNSIDDNLLKFDQQQRAPGATRCDCTATSSDAMTARDRPLSPTETRSSSVESLLAQYLLYKF